MLAASPEGVLAVLVVLEHAVPGAWAALVNALLPQYRKGRTLPAWLVRLGREGPGN